VIGKKIQLNFIEKKENEKGLRKGEGTRYGEKTIMQPEPTSKEHKIKGGIKGRRGFQILEKYPLGKSQKKKKNR